MRLASLIFILLFLSACSVTTTSMVTGSVSSCPADSAILGSQWFNQKHTYRLRHGGILQSGKNTIPITGFMVLNTNDATADVVIMTGLDIKLATLKISRSSYKTMYASPVARRIPHFLEQCAFSIQRIFLTDFPKTESPCFMVDDMREYIEETLDGTLRSKIDPSSEFMTGKILKSNKEIWTVNYEGMVEINGIIFPEKVTFNEIDRNYVVTLLLTSAKIQ